MRLFLLLALSLLSAGCASRGQAWVELGGERFSVEIADEPDERARGLMFRDRLAADAGMLFVHAEEQPLAYWMKNTRIPLDILYFDARRRLVSVSRASPCSLGDRCPPYPSAGPALYVLELNAGTAGRLGVERGDEIRFSPDIPERGAP
ncbi:DUF192 domain-containing protein [Arenimonas fontis]|uniref:DUF192 domain-containing protein n=1 Tax=Arenimonas fontis TaxID=2608255 RepID=A0A5B2ZB84_9GAMM|nr:DUF192 domain-containing protein [Arenimonas fontis]KAA2284392.1 DUF192 domain-containing protein [Arenimonas fontis]